MLVDGAVGPQRVRELADARHIIRSCEPNLHHAMVAPRLTYGPRMTKSIPDGIRMLTSQLTIDGASDAIEFYKSAFGAEEFMAPDPSGKKIGTRRSGSETRGLVNDLFPEMGATRRARQLWLYSETWTPRSSAPSTRAPR